MNNRTTETGTPPGDRPLVVVVADGDDIVPGVLASADEQERRPALVDVARHVVEAGSPDARGNAEPAQAVGHAAGKGQADLQVASLEAARARLGLARVDASLDAVPVETIEQ